MIQVEVKRSIPIPMPTPGQVERAMRLSYAMNVPIAIVNSITTGAFIAGFLVALGADNIAIGWITGLAQVFVVCQLAAAWLIARKWSRKRLSVFFAFVTPAGWMLVAALGLFGSGLSGGARIALFALLFVAVAASGHFTANARQSWLGELVPEERRGRYFAICWLVSNLMAIAVTLAAGAGLDAVKSHGLPAFGGLFLLAGVCGVGTALFYAAQPDCPIEIGRRRPFAHRVLSTFSNRRLMRLTLVQLVIALGGIASPFYQVYLLRDVGVTYLSAGILTSITISGVVCGSLLCTRLISALGCRPMIIMGLAAWAPMTLIWIFIPPGAPERAVMLLPYTNFIAGVATSCLSIAIGTLVYKLTDSEGRAVQLATSSSLVILAGAPMPFLGGWLLSRIRIAWPGADLRVNFVIAACFTLLACLAARRLIEPGSVSARRVVFEHFPNRVAGWLGAYVPAAARLSAPRRTPPGGAQRDE